MPTITTKALSGSEWILNVINRAPFLSSPCGENSKDSLSSLTLKPLLIENQCVVLPEPGQSFFRDLVEVNKCYVDKTECLWKIISRPRPFWFLLCPRRFGKTLLKTPLNQFSRLASLGLSTLN